MSAAFIYRHLWLNRDTGARASERRFCIQHANTLWSTPYLTSVVVVEQNKETMRLYRRAGFTDNPEPARPSRLVRTLPLPGNR